MDNRDAKPPILVIGGTGTVGSRLVQHLSSRCYPVIAASRSRSQTDGHDHGIVFDWHDHSTWSNPFRAAAGPLRAVYIVASPVVDSAPIMMEFIDFARDKGVRRFVLQSSSATESGGPAVGKVHAYLRELGQRGEVDWAVLRPTWFQQNFGEQPFYIKSIKDESRLYSATSDAKIPWVSADDIAAVAAKCLTSPDPPNTEYLVLGPELLSYSDIADILTKVLGRKIVHVDLSRRDLEKRHQSFGMPEESFKMMGALQTSIKFGSENRTNDAILTLTGAAPKMFAEYAESAKAIWEPGDPRKHIDVYA
ncbi:hypothetical protein B0T26DRAFT_670273 [Lasiosphaeria miniovina]|uniref:NmrA-like domain-containing protein n=1 Tax=Lasiosphaeria miniovina TaxID=1954250 RepID=A0AA40BH68_9PEZI|nr:uncharacterized protein B0T26DRAFT_670273 [Lasiosphaeria miniovina]KAK0733928.1 hypothetical protein B0T26DRAFT_670273 [Lasiosphaeria miniovina]